ncbi:MAG: hypothetical protein DMD39_11990 [Gemmatimonadetes bacterium]|nr:MAG: hypothetical protein DMD39_11990 [Gemmatimonadota bacterium]
MPEAFTSEERSLLSPYFTNLDGSIFALVNLPEVVKGALFARYSRSSKSLRRLFLDEFLTSGTLWQPLPTPLDTTRADQLYARILSEYGDDSVAQLGGVHLACEGVSNIATKVLEWGRLMAYLEQSTRYIPYDDRPDGKYRYHIPQELNEALRGRYITTQDQLFEVYRRLLPTMQSFYEQKYPRDATTSPGAHRASTRAKALDTLRGLLPAATKSNVGIFGTGQAYEQLLLRMRAHRLAEARHCADLMLHELRKVIPAFLQRVDAPDRGDAWSAYLSDNRLAMRDLSSRLFRTERAEPRPEVLLTDFDPDGEVKVVAAALYATSNLPDDQLLDLVQRMSEAERHQILQNYVGVRSNRRQRPGRAFERTSYRFDLLGDYGAFRDLQRHRLLTIEWQALSPDHGYVMPEAIREVGAEADWREAMRASADLHKVLMDAGLYDVASYAICMAYRVRFFMQMNAREAMHVIELRTAPQGHPSYRRICQEMHRLISDEAGHSAIAASMSFADHSEVELERLEAERTAERKAAVRSGSLLYPREFAEGLPPGRSWDQRPLVNLLRGHHSDADAEIERIERWFRELKAPEERKRPLYGNLREVAPRNFWSGLYELMTDRIFREQGWISNYEPDIEGRTPDFLVECPEIDNYRFVAEVMTASQGSEADEQERMLYAVASELDKLEHRIGVFVESVCLPDDTPNFDQLRARVTEWLDTCDASQESSLALEPPKYPIALRLSTIPQLRLHPAPIVEGIRMPGGLIESDLRIRAEIERKIRRYQAVKALKLPFVIFVWEGDWLQVNETSIEWALFGRDQLVRQRQRGQIISEWRRAPGGLFGFSGEGGGTLRNTRVSAVAYCSRVKHQGAVYVNMRLYHHPFAENKLPLHLFSGVAQCIPTSVSDDKATLSWIVLKRDREASHFGLKLR